MYTDTSQKVDSFHQVCSVLSYIRLKTVKPYALLVIAYALSQVISNYMCQLIKFTFYIVDL